MVRVYLDIDGVLLGQEAGKPVLARHAEKLIEFLIDHFDVYWLTTHCSGDAQRPINYLSRYAPASFLNRLSVIKPTRFQVLKTEALRGDFYWLDDNPMQAEVADLQRRDQFDRWIDVNTRVRPDDLLFAIEELSNVLRGHAAATTHEPKPVHQSRHGRIGLRKIAIEKRTVEVPAVARPYRVDLIDLFDPAVDVIAGTWRIESEALVGESADHSRVDFLYQPPDEYDFRTAFTVGEFQDAVQQICRGPGCQFTLVLRKDLAAFDVVDSRPCFENKTAVKKPHLIDRGKHYTSLIKVRKTGIEAYVNGQLITSLKTDYSNVGLYRDWKLSRNDVVGLGMHNGNIRFDKAEVVEVTGEGKLLSNSSPP